MLDERREPCAHQRFELRQAPDQQRARNRHRRLRHGEGERRAPDARSPARDQHAAERHAEHEGGEHQRAGPNGVAEHASERAEP
jgi:hypothetical protein